MFSNLSTIEIIFYLLVSLHKVYSPLDLYFNGFIQKKRRSYIPLIFWYLSIFGGIGLLTYAIFRKDPVIILGSHLEYLFI